jgi:multiple sugar transport system permease protein
MAVTPKGWRIYFMSRHSSLQRSLPIWMLLPALIVLLAIQVYPSLYSFFLAFSHKYEGFTQFAGLNNFRILFSSQYFWGSVRNTLIFTGSYLIITTILAMIMAVLLNRRTRLTSFYMVLLFVPWVLSDVVVGTIWRWMFISDYGILQDALRPLINLAFLANPIGAMTIVIASSIWQSLAFATLLLLAALQMVPRDIIEMAAIDGATRWQTFWRVTIPIIRSQVLVVWLLLSIRSINSIGLILVITGGGPARATNTLGLFLYQEAWQFGDIGLGAAIAVLMFVLNLLLTITYLIALKNR